MVNHNGLATHDYSAVNLSCKFPMLILGVGDKKHPRRDPELENPLIYDKSRTITRLATAAYVGNLKHPKVCEIRVVITSITGE
jgi:hypothetical protein